MKLAEAAGSIVELSCRRAKLLLVVGLTIAVVCVAFIIANFSISTDTEALISSNVAWRREATQFDKAFPGKSDEIVVVVDGRTPELAEAGAAALVIRLQPRTDLYRDVSRPAGGPFFDRAGLLFLPREEVKSTVAGLLTAQPLLGPLAADPSLRGAMTSLTSSLAQVQGGGVPLLSLLRPMRETERVFHGALHGQPAWFGWSSLLGGASDASASRRVVLLEPKLDYAKLMPGAPATEAARSAARDLGLTPARGVSVRITGSVPLDDEQLGSLAQGSAPIAAAMLAAVVGVLWLAVRSPKIILAIVATVACGLLATAAFGLIAFGRFNLISVAFVALFVGLGVDFSIQFAVRLRAELAQGDELRAALASAGRGVGSGLAIAAAATAIGFFAFYPTQYVGFSELGVIAGVGMIIAFTLSLTLLPALLTLLRPAGATEAAGFPALAPLGRAVASRRGWVLWGGGALAAACACLLPLLRFDFDPVSLDNPRTESVSTLRDLARNPETTLNTLDVLAPSAEAATALAARLAALPQVARAVTLSTFAPPDQPAKLEIIADAATLLGPTVDPFDVAAPPNDAELKQSLETARASLEIAGLGRSPAAHQALALAGVLEQLEAASPTTRALAQDRMTGTFPVLLGQLRALLGAQPVTLATLPASLVREWRAPDGRVRIEVFPRGDANDVAVIDRFVAAVLHVAPDAVGAPIAVRGSRTTILRAFVAAMALSTLAIVLLLFTLLRSLRDVAITLAPVGMAALLTFATCAVLGIAINVENIVAVPLLVSVGTAFTIYFTLAWRRGAANLLDTSMARGVVFSALTTGLAFGSLWLSPHPGTSSLGALLMISLVWTLVCALGLQTALLGPSRTAAELSFAAAAPGAALQSS